MSPIKLIHEIDLFIYFIYWMMQMLKSVAKDLHNQGRVLYLLNANEQVRRSIEWILPAEQVIFLPKMPWKLLIYVCCHTYVSKQNQKQLEVSSYVAGHRLLDYFCCCDFYNSIAEIFIGFWIKSSGVI